MSWELDGFPLIVLHHTASMAAPHVHGSKGKKGWHGLPCILSVAIAVGSCYNVADPFLVSRVFIKLL